MNNLARAVLILIIILAMHLVEEVRTGFRRRFPLGEIPGPIFVFLNALVYLYCLATFVLAIRQDPAATPMAWVFAAAMLLNGGGHLSIMVVKRRYFPGGYTAVLLLGGALYLVVTLAKYG